MDSPAQSAYERQLGFNSLTRWLHSFRYRQTLDVLRALPQPINVLELGSADGKLFGVLNPLLRVTYTGVELQSEFVTSSRQRYGHHSNFRILHRSAVDLSGIAPPDVVIAMETLEHIPERDVVRIVESVAQLRPRLFLCSVPVEIGPAICFKNVGSFLCGYNRHREYTWRETWLAGTYNFNRLPRRGGGHKGFDWRWLAETIRYNMHIRAMRKFPFNFLPAGLSTSVYFIAEPWPSGASARGAPPAHR